jgi:hypothetical protein
MAFLTPSPRPLDEVTLKAGDMIDPVIGELSIARPLDIGNGVTIAVVTTEGPASDPVIGTEAGDEFVPFVLD